LDIGGHPFKSATDSHNLYFLIMFIICSPAFSSRHHIVLLTFALNRILYCLLFFDPTSFLSIATPLIMPNTVHHMPLPSFFFDFPFPFHFFSLSLFFFLQASHTAVTHSSFSPVRSSHPSFPPVRKDAGIPRETPFFRHPLFFFIPPRSPGLTVRLLPCLS